ncbi:MAG: FtsX-like permease family protein [Burkholderiales bacterium]|nr:FtsX-like permease family protein [Burkholderiales bacterium]GIK85294.1 MAG: inner membrane transport permease [Betaproteobacteria bacterium]
MRTLALGLRMLRRDWRAGELRVLVAALVLAVASVGTVGFFADRVKGALTRQANLLLGGDLMITGDRPLPAAFAERARADGLATTPVIRFNSMVQRADVPADGAAAILTDVKAVGAGYPLRGSVTLVGGEGREDRVAAGIPPPGAAWADVRLAQRLGIGKGARLSVGETTIVVGEILRSEPEVAGVVFSLGPKLLMNLDDVPATNLLQPGNRASHRLLVAAPGEAALERYRRWLGGELKAGQRMENVRDLRPEVRQTLERAEKFLGLAALVAVLLAAVAIALAASRYLRRHLDAAAMMRCFGASRGRTLALFALQFLVLGVAACAAGVLVALGGQALLVGTLSSLMDAGLPAPTWGPALASFATGLLLLFGFALPPLVALSGVPPLRVLRRDLPRPKVAGVLAYALGAATVAMLIAWQAREAQAGAIMVGGVGALLLVAALAAWGLIVLLKRLPQRGVSWRFGLANLSRRRFASSLQIGALALGLMALLLLTLVRGDLMQAWRANLPPDAPNQFLVNVLPDQAADARATLSQRFGRDIAFSPMVRGRLVEVNGQALDTTRFADARARRLAEREFNLSWTDALPGGNRVVAGRFWPPGARGAEQGMSLEDGIAESLGVRLGDALTFDVAGARVTAKVTSLRKVDWDSFRVNFFALFPPGPLDDKPVSYIAAFRAPDTDHGWLAPLVQKHPNILAIDVGELMRQVQGIVDRVSRAIEFVFLFTLAGGLLVLQAAVAATQDERRFDAAVLRTLGASRRQLQSAQVAEFLLLGALAGLVAAAGATAIGWALSDRVFRIPFQANPLVWLYGVGGGALAVAFAGWLGTRNTVRQPPLAVIRQLG